MIVESFQKYKNKINVFFEDGEKLVLYYDVFLNEQIFIGDEFDKNRINEILTANEIYYLKQSAFRSLIRRAHSRFELYKKLSAKTKEKNLIQTVLDFLEERGYLNDEKFAEAYIEERVKHKKLGINRVRAELFKKGVDKKIIEDKLIIDDELSQKNAAELAEKKLRIARSSSKKIEKSKLKQKIYSHLLMRGYSSEIIRKVFDTLNFDE